MYIPVIYLVFITVLPVYLTCYYINSMLDNYFRWQLDSLYTRLSIYNNLSNNSTTQQLTMDHKFLKPRQLELDPNASDAEKHWKHWKKTFDNFLVSFTDQPNDVQDHRPPPSRYHLVVLRTVISHHLNLL